MARLFEDQYWATRTSGGSVAAFWLRAVGDALVHGGAERLSLAAVRGKGVIREARRWRWYMHALVQDIRHSVRLIVRQPGLTFVALLTMALGIGANTAIFSAVDTVLLRPLPYADPDRLVVVWEKRPAEGVMKNVVAAADYVDWSQMNTVFEATAAMISVTADLTGAGEPARLSAAVVSPAFFDVLRVQPALGRSFRAEEARAGQHRVIVLGYGLWQSRFGSDPAVVGRKVLSE